MASDAVPGEDAPDPCLVEDCPDISVWVPSELSNIKNRLEGGSSKPSGYSKLACLIEGVVDRTGMSEGVNIRARCRNSNCSDSACHQRQVEGRSHLAPSWFYDPTDGVIGSLFQAVAYLALTWPKTRA